MGDIINLNKFRKERQREAEKKAARDNRVRFGRTGAEKASERATAEKAEAELSGKMRDARRDEDGAPDAPEPKAR